MGRVAEVRAKESPLSEAEERRLQIRESGCRYGSMTLMKFINTV